MKNNLTKKKKLKIIHLILILLLITSSTQLVATNKSSDQHWGQSERISFEQTRHAYRAVLAIDSNGTTHIAWKEDTNYDNSGDDWDVIYRYKRKNDTNWSNPEVVSTESNKDCSCLALATGNNGTVHIVWKDRTNYKNCGNDSDIFYKFKEPNKNWSITEVVSTESTGNCNCPSIAIDDIGTIHVVWPDETDYNNAGADYDIFYKYKPIGGNWSNTEIVSKESVSDSLDSSITVDINGNVHVVWQEENSNVYANTDWDIFYNQKVNVEGWNNPIVLSVDSTENSLDPTIESDENNIIYVIWKDNTDYNSCGKDYDVFMKTLENNTWSTTEVISTESTGSINWPSLEIGVNNSLHVAWTDTTNYNGCGTDYNVVYKYRLQHSLWSPIEIVSTESEYTSNWPSFDSDSDGSIHLSWWDDENGTWTIYYIERDNIFDIYSANNNTNVNKTVGFEIAVTMISISLMVALIKNRKKQT